MMARSTRLLLVACILLLAAACAVTYHAPAPRTAPPPVRADVGLFYDALMPYGTWVHVHAHGWVWYPSHMGAGWRPYTQGRWVYTDYGWTWVSDLDWGWAPFHYGRWFFDRRYGWTWIPGKEWGPAWVAWRHGNGWVGWSALPPQVRWRAGVGLDLRGVSLDAVIQPSWWCFVEDRRLLDPRIGRALAPPSRNGIIVRATQNATDYAVVNRKVVNRSIGVDPIQRVVRRPVHRYRVVDAGGSGKEPRARVQGREVRVFRPVAGPAAPRPKPSTPAPKRTVAPRKPREDKPPARPAPPAPSDAAHSEDSAKERKAEKASPRESEAKAKPEEVEQESGEPGKKARPPRDRKSGKKKRFDKPPDQD